MTELTAVTVNGASALVPAKPSEPTDADDESKHSMVIVPGKLWAPLIVTKFARGEKVMVSGPWGMPPLGMEAARLKARKLGELCPLTPKLLHSSNRAPPSFPRGPLK